VIEESVREREEKSQNDLGSRSYTGSDVSGFVRRSGWWSKKPSGNES